MSKSEITPMKKQYNELKERYKDSILLFRLGDFYEMFDEDARVAAKELDIALTTRDRNKSAEEQTPMCGVPFHSAQGYITRLVQKGYKVAVCEQMESPAQAKGIVKRDVIRVITPGTLTDSSMLDESSSNYLAAVCIEGDRGAVAFCDISTGEFCAAHYTEAATQHIQNELTRFSPRETVLSEQAMGDAAILALLSDRLNCVAQSGGHSFSVSEGEARMCRQLRVRSLADLAIEDKPEVVSACGALLSYVAETQKAEPVNIESFDLFTGGSFMELDYATRRSLELTENQRTGERRGSLLWVLDRTKTSMGARTLRSWTERPLLSLLAIRRRHAALGELAADNIRRAELRLCLAEVADLQRLMSRISTGSVNARDLMTLALSAAVLPKIKSLLSDCKSSLLTELLRMDDLADLMFEIYRAICEKPPFSVREGGMLRSGYSERVDKLRDIRDNGARLVSELEARERERTGIKKLKVSYNKVFGYYIDVPNGASNVPLPDTYIRKQTLVANERYFTEELKELESSIVNARDTIADLEYYYFCEVRDYAAERAGRVLATAASVAQLDALCSLAEVAVRNSYVCPELDYSGSYDIKDGRHAVVEAMLSEEHFVPNDLYMDKGGSRALIITGPNMAGKSTYMRQNALIVLMAQMGSFVPARSARLGITDRVFTRIGASDDISSGQSTFMVEMSEVSGILKYATQNSMIILDEVGRGTSTYDGMAIARAVLEYCASKERLGAKTMFATHYHELTALAQTVDGVKNCHTSARKRDNDLIFLRKVTDGAADDSYGIEVAGLAGVPSEIVTRAKLYLRELENSTPIAAEAMTRAEPVNLSDTYIEEKKESALCERLSEIDPNSLSPLEALNLIYELKGELNAPK